MIDGHISLEEHRARVDALLAQLHACFVAAGGDTDGDGPTHTAQFAVEEVERLRKDYDEACDEIWKLERSKQNV